MSSETLVITTAILSAVTSSGVMSLVIYLLQRRDRKREQEEASESAQSKMLRGLAHDRILYLTDRYVRRGCITLKEKRNLKYLYDPYKAMNGNGDCEIGFNACEKLPVASEDEAEEIDTSIRRKEFGYEV